MKSIGSRQLAAKPGHVWKDLEREGALVITKDGVPRSIMVPTSDQTLLEDMQDLIFSRARRAVRAIRQQAKPISPAEIDAEIAAARKARKR
jgi:hypothetical protein